MAKTLFKDLRKKRDFSIREVAEGTGLDKSRMVRIEQDFDKVYLFEAIKLAEFYRIDMKYILDHHEPLRSFIAAETAERAKRAAIIADLRAKGLNVVDDLI